MSNLNFSASTQTRNLLISLLSTDYLLSVKDLAEFLECSPRVAWKLLVSERVYSKQIGKAWVTYIPDVIKAAKKDSLVYSYLLKIAQKEAAKKSPSEPAKSSCSVSCPMCGSRLTVPYSPFRRCIGCPYCDFQIRMAKVAEPSLN